MTLHGALPFNRRPGLRTWLIRRTSAVEHDPSDHLWTEE